MTMTAAIYSLRMEAVSAIEYIHYYCGNVKHAHEINSECSFRRQLYFAGLCCVKMMQDRRYGETGEEGEEQSTGFADELQAYHIRATLSAVPEVNATGESAGTQAADVLVCCSTQPLGWRKHQ